MENQATKILKNTSRNKWKIYKGIDSHKSQQEKEKK